MFEEKEDMPAGFKILILLGKGLTTQDKSKRGKKNIVNKNTPSYPPFRGLGGKENG